MSSPRQLARLIHVVEVRISQDLIPPSSLDHICSRYAAKILILVEESSFLVKSGNPIGLQSNFD